MECDNSHAARAKDNAGGCCYDDNTHKYTGKSRDLDQGCHSIAEVVRNGARRS